jgi:ergothioneine biosynthesis protein EgtB
MPTADDYAAIRSLTTRLAEPLSPEEQQVQSMADASPTKWHLAHTTWFFEEFVLQEFEPGFRPHDPRWRQLFNSYYEAVGPRIARPSRGLITRPSLAEVLGFRRAVDERIAALLRAGPPASALERIELGLHHEQQHQELLLTDALHLLAQNPLKPAYLPLDPTTSPAYRRGEKPPATAWRSFAGGLAQIGAAGNHFTFDNERPRHRVHLEPYELATRLVTQGEFAAFLDAGGYREPRFWLAEGWEWLRREAIAAPACWSGEGDARRRFTLRGEQPLAPDAPVAHVSFFEADAFARFAGARLPTEQEWEHAASEEEQAGRAFEGSFLEGGALEPGGVFERRNDGTSAKAATSATTARAQPPLHGLFGEVWQWTASPYVGYPGFRPADGAIGEYNGKFMVNQLVLRGASCLTPKSHARLTYRNFFPAPARWQMTGLRLARDR